VPVPYLYNFVAREMTVRALPADSRSQSDDHKPPQPAITSLDPCRAVPREGQPRGNASATGDRQPLSLSLSRRGKLHRMPTRCHQLSLAQRQTLWYFRPSPWPRR